MVAPNATNSAPSRAAHAAQTDEALARLGLTALESDVYRFLLTNPGSTGYRVAQALGKPVGNIYKTVEALESKGAAATSDDEGNRTSVAIPIAEWIRARRKEFDRACAAATVALAHESLAGGAGAGANEPPDDAVYRLSDRQQLIERCRTMILGARQFVLMTLASPALVDEFAPALRRAARRTPIALKVFQPATIRGVEVIVDPREARALENGPGAWLALNVDGIQCISALFDLAGDALHTANWTRNPLISWTAYTGLSSDHILAAVRACMRQGGTTKDIERIFKRLAPFENSASAGKLAMRQRYRSAAPRSQARGERRSSTRTSRN